MTHTWLTTQVALTIYIGGLLIALLHIRQHVHVAVARSYPHAAAHQTTRGSTTLPPPRCCTSGNMWQ